MQLGYYAGLKCWDIVYLIYSITTYWSWLPLCHMDEDNPSKAQVDMINKVKCSSKVYMFDYRSNQLLACSVIQMIGLGKQSTVFSLLRLLETKWFFFLHVVQKSFWFISPLAIHSLYTLESMRPSGSSGTHPFVMSCGGTGTSMTPSGVLPHQQPPCSCNLPNMSTTHQSQL